MREMFDIIIGLAFLALVAYFVLTRTTLISDLIEGFNAWREGDTKKFEEYTIGEIAERKETLSTTMPNIMPTIPRVERKEIGYPDERIRVDNADLGDHTQITDMPLFEDPQAPEKFRKWFSGISRGTI